MLSLLVAAGALVASPMRLVSPAASPAVAARTPAAPLMGVTVKTTKPGDGKTYPKAGQMVKAHYTGRLLDGTVFDSSRGFLKQPFQFQIGAGDVIRGWDQASACSSHPLAGTAPARCSASMGITRTRVRSRPPALGAGHAEDEQGREGDSHMHARLRMYARTHRTMQARPAVHSAHPPAPR